MNNKKLGRNLDDPESRRFWEAAERAASHRRILVIPDTPNEADDVPLAQAEKRSESDKPKECD